MARAEMVRRAQAHSQDTEEGIRGNGSEGRQNPAAGYSHPLDEATDCDGVPPSPPLFLFLLLLSSTSCFCSSAVVVVPLLSLSLRATPLSSTSSTYCESIEPETRGVDAPSCNGTCCHHRCRGEISEQRESRAFCLDGNVGPQIFHREFRG